MRSLVICAVLLSSFGGDAWAGAKVSAFQKDSKLGANHWNGAAAIDGKLNTAWMVPGESDNRGEWIDIDVPQGDVDKVSIFPGFAKTEETFADYPRLKKVRVDIFALDDDQVPKQVGTVTLDIADKAELQEFDIPDAKIAAGLFGGKVRFTVLEIHDGADYPNLALGEVLVHLKEFEANVGLGEVSGESPGKGKDLMRDGNPKTAWAAPGTSGSITLTTNGFGLSSVGFVGAGKEYGRVKTVEITAGGLTTKSELLDKPDAQWARVPAFNGYTGGAFGGEIEVKILETWPGTKPELGISEIKARATTLESI